MPRFSEFEFNRKMSEVKDYVIDACNSMGIPLDKVARASQRVSELDPLLYTFDDGGSALEGRFREIMKDEGLDTTQIDNFMMLLHGLRDPFGDFIGSIVNNIFVPGPTTEVPPDWPESVENSRGKPFALGYFEDEDILGTDDDEDIVEGYDIVNPCMLKVVGPSGAAVDYALPGWSCVVAGIIVLAAAIGNEGGDFLSSVVAGFRKTGRELKRAGKKIGKLIKKIF